MSENAADRDLARRAIRSRRLRAASLILPLIGVFLFVTPAVHIARGATTFLGLPPLFLYLFGLWITLIIVSYRLSRRLAADTQE